MKIQQTLLVSAAMILGAAPAFSQDLSSTPLTEPDAFVTQMVEIASKKAHNVELYGNSARGTSNQTVISRPGASFIKVNFDKFNLPPGAYVEISNFDGSETYRYGQGYNTPRTFNAEAGQNGTDRFSAMSISGDYASVRLVGNNGKLRPSVHRVAIDSYMEGFPEDQVEQVIANGDFSTESTCGVNERRDVQCWASSHPTEFERTRPVARILVNGSSLCTAWRVGADNHVFTNEHCVNSQSGIQNTEVWFNYQRPGCGSGDANAGTTKVTGNTLFDTDFTYDYTLFSVNNFASIQSFGHFGLDVREATDQEQIYIPQHGSGNPKELAIESDQNTGGVCRVDNVSQTGRAANTDIGYFCDTIGGSSGSPVLASSTNNVIALHHFGGCTNGGVKVVEIWPRVSSFFGGVIPIGDNGGGNANPTSSFTYNCTLTACSFDGSGSSDSDGTIASYDWDFGDGNSASGATTSHTYAAGGSYSVSLTVTDDEGGMGSSSQTLNVDDGLNPPAAPSNLTGDAVKQGKGKKNSVTVSVDLSWNDNSNNETGFIIERCQESGKGKNKVCPYAAITTVAADSTNYSDTSPPSGTIKYRVKATNGNGDSSYTNEVKI